MNMLKRTIDWSKQASSYSIKYGIKNSGASLSLSLFTLLVVLLLMYVIMYRILGYVPNGLWVFFTPMCTSISIFALFFTLIST